MKRIIGILMLALLALGSFGCSGEKAAPALPSASAEEAGYVTAFGMVRCSETLTLLLPAEVLLTGTAAREGQALAPGSPVFRLDMARLRAEADRVGRELGALKAAREKCTLETEQAERGLADARSAAEAMDGEKLLGILKRLAGAGRGPKRGACEAELLDCLKAIGCVDQYQALAALAADRRTVEGSARPALLLLADRLNRDCRERAAALLALKREACETDAALLPLARQEETLGSLLGGQTVCGIGSLDAGGLFTTAGRPLLLSSLPSAAGEAVVSGKPVAVFEALDTAEVIVNVEEQLIPGVEAGAEAQISPLYDRGTVWLGNVTAVSDRAITVNGETVVPVTVDAKKLALGPGYDVVVKIYPPKDRNAD